MKGEGLELFWDRHAMALPYSEKEEQGGPRRLEPFLDWLEELRPPLDEMAETPPFDKPFSLD